VIGRELYTVGARSVLTSKALVVDLLLKMCGTMKSSWFCSSGR